MQENNSIKKYQLKTMARKAEIGIDSFPRWNPQRGTRDKFSSMDKRRAYKALRNSSSGFIAIPEVRRIIFKRDGHKCLQCGSEENLQIDHKIGVIEIIENRLDIKILNTQENLQTLCASCNAAKPAITPINYDI